MHLQLWQWGLAIFGALLIGTAKTGFSGAGILAVALFAVILPARASTGIVLPLLSTADIVAVTVFRRHGKWPHIVHMFPWTAAGVISGYYAMKHMDDQQVKYFIGVILIFLCAFQAMRKWQSSEAAAAEPESGERPRASIFYVATMGLLAGFLTMMANAAGPVMIIYMLAIGLPKMEFVGTTAWFFFIVNLFKLPFSQHLGVINQTSMLFDLKLVPAVIVGALCGRSLVTKVNQNTFEILALAFAIIGALKLLL